MIRRHTWILVYLAVGVVGFAQAALTDFPVGVTVMEWALRGGSPSLVQGLSLTVEAKADGRFKVVLGVASEGTAADLEALGFLGSSVFMQAAGANVDLSALLTLIRRREALKVGEDYALPGGVVFQARARADVAGVGCLIGEYRTADRPDTVVEVGLALTDPVYFVPLLRVTEGGTVTFEMVLTAYRRP
ncbi:hypothetical protein H5T53_03120 [Candidatus Bipolaricaulota bacterium]|nr:hypothetical protein [Candidatus Bipolaricaulota bacterium]